MKEKIKNCIETGGAVLGIELGSTRIKAVLIDSEKNVIAQGNHQWENKFEDGLWTYSEQEIWHGLQSAYSNLREDVKSNYGIELRKLAGAGVSAMMHGYMAFDKAGNLLVPFRTWRNTNTGKAAAELSKLFNFNIPLRWSISHLYEAILEEEPHIKDVDFQTTLAGYVHWKLTGEKVLGVGDASGMMPVDPSTGYYDSRMITAFESLLKEKGLDLKVKEIFPKVLDAGENAGYITENGAVLLDVSGNLEPGVPMSPPEGDAGTGMVATNAVRPRTGNVSAGTSSFSMIVLERELSRPYEEIDIVTTPDGKPVAMVHCNNCTSDINAWVGLLNETLKLFGKEVTAETLYNTLFNEALKGDESAGGLMAYNFLSGEPIAGLMRGTPLFMHSVGDKFNLANFMRCHLYSALACLKIGNDILFKKEKVEVDRLTGHGGFFKTPVVGQRILAAALDSPITVMETAGEGGAWGMALLADYMVNKLPQQSLPDYLEKKVFNRDSGLTVSPEESDVKGFEKFIALYKECLPVEASAVEHKN